MTTLAHPTRLNFLVGVGAAVAQIARLFVVFAFPDACEHWVAQSSERSSPSGLAGLRGTAAW